MSSDRPEVSSHAEDLGSRRSSSLQAAQPGPGFEYGHRTVGLDAGARADALTTLHFRDPAPTPN